MTSPPHLANRRGPVFVVVGAVAQLVLSPLPPPEWLLRYQILAAINALTTHPPERFGETSAAVSDAVRGVRSRDEAAHGGAPERRRDGRSS
jgi:hypothetical protein